MTTPLSQLRQAKTLVERLAHLSADSIWARRASGLRASLDKRIAQIESGHETDLTQLDHLTQLGFEILTKAAAEIIAPEDILRKERPNP